MFFAAEHKTLSQRERGLHALAEATALMTTLDGIGTTERTSDEIINRFVGIAHTGEAIRFCANCEHYHSVKIVAFSRHKTIRLFGPRGAAAAGAHMHAHRRHNNAVQLTKVHPIFGIGVHRGAERVTDALAAINKH